MQVQSTAILDALVIRPEVYPDARGQFLETWNQRRFAEHGLDLDFVQDNHSRSTQGTVRGLHYQIGRPQGKLVRAASGRVFDVAVDLRRSSTTFGTWIGYELSDENRQSLWIPPGCAHGFLVLTETADFTYKCTDFYDPESERTLLWNDPTLAIDWPTEGLELKLSAKDADGTPFRQAECFP